MPVRMAGCVGDDAFGESYLRNFAENGVDTSLVRVRKGQTTGTATIEVNAEGENHIVVVPAANGECDMDWLEEILPAVADGDLFLLQHEIPLPVVHEAIRRLHAMGKTVISIPRPPRRAGGRVGNGGLYHAQRIGTGRHHPRAGQGRGRARAREISARPGRGLRDQQVRRQWRLRGARGAEVVHVPGFKVKVVDTTAAGDTFNAGFAAGLALGLPPLDAVKVGHAAAALSVTAFGAQGGNAAHEQLFAAAGERLEGKTGAVRLHAKPPRRASRGHIVFGLSNSSPAVRSTPADGRRPGRPRGRTRPRGCARSAALPDAHVVLLEDHAVLDVLKQRQIALLVFLFDLGHAFKERGDLGKAFLAGFLAKVAYMSVHS